MSAALDDVFKSSDYRISPFELESVADRAPRGRGGGRCAEPGFAAAVGAEGLRGACAAAMRRRGHRALDLEYVRERCRLSSASAAWSSRTCRRPSRARSAASICDGAKPPGAGQQAAARPASSGKKTFTEPQASEANRRPRRRRKRSRFRGRPVRSAPPPRSLPTAATARSDGAVRVRRA